MGIPLAGHLYPMAALIDAAARAGHDVSVLTGTGGADLLPHHRVIEAGPSVYEAMAETARRLDGDDGTQAGAGAVELFGSVRLDLGAEAVLAAARDGEVDLVVGETTDQLAPLVAAATGAPYVEFMPSAPLPADLMAAIHARAATTFDERGLQRPAAVAVIDPFPRVLMTEQERAGTAGHWSVRPTVYTEHGAVLPDLPVRPDAPVALVSLGTSVDAPETESMLIGSLVEAGLQVVTTGRRGADAATQTHPDVHAAGFVPLELLLPLADVVVSAGGTGTVLAALSAGVPLVIRPFLADQPWNAARLSGAGVAIAVDDAAEAGQAVLRVLEDPSYRTAAAEVAAAIAATEDADTVLGRLTALVTG